ncbi:4'-phosphopantetheinyl transferase superfamily protein [Rugamonas sp.]|uniref:4'-phosphopantetheinyl transferase family protein n=1 Tax=Rugamonas sp. TaxID=1926287 RepID=UPI0025D7ABA3|nr:4'-phosphopantetheinyl transferase superfamily protein [Rugamonas sp.]
MRHEARLWLTNTAAVRDDDVQAWLPLLSESEAARYRRFVRPLRQRQFLIGRVMLRRALCAVLDLPAGVPVVEEHVGHAPRVTLPAGVPAPGFSIAHSGDWVACAVSAGTALGLDIELLDPGRDIIALAEQNFDAIELAALGMEPPARRMAAFYRMWSGKEARFKLGAAFDAQASCIALPHPHLSIVVCSAQPLAAAPAIEAFDIA